MTERYRNDGVGFAGMMNKVVRTKQDTYTLATQIDKMVYQLYDLSDDEIKIIEETK